MDNRGIDIFHCFRVAELSFRLCNYLKLSSIETEEIILSALMHDIGKSRIDINILNKVDKLNIEEWKQIKLHSKYGAAIALMAGYSTNVAKNILYHHENSDGSGYPKGIKGNEIPLGAAIIRICDSYDAMRSIRSYKKPMSHETAREELIKNEHIYRKDLIDLFFKIDFSIFEGFYKQINIDCN